MITFILYLLIGIGLLLLIGSTFFYGSAFLIAPFVNMYYAIKQKDKLALYGAISGIFTILVIIFIAFMESK